MASRPQPLFRDPILNSPFEEPTRHFAFDENGITDEIRTGRRPSTHFIPIPKPKKRGKQLSLDVETGTELRSNEQIDYVRTQVAKWRDGRYQGATPVTRRLLSHWSGRDRARPLFFCQREAVETAIYAFGTQLLCEQVVGRALRRVSYAVNPQGRFDAEYAEIYGVPFDFTPWAGPEIDPKPGPRMTHVFAAPEREALTLTFPRVVGYRYDLPTERLEARFDDSSRMVLSTLELPTVTQMSSILGEDEEHKLESLEGARDQRIAFLLAKHVLERNYRDAQGSPRATLFPQLLRIARAWLDTCVEVTDDTYKGLLLIRELADRAAEKIQSAIVRNAGAAARIVPELHPFEPTGSTRHVDFETSKPTYRTRADRCPVNYVVADTGSWEQKVAAALEDMDEVEAYVKNQGVGFKIPYVFAGEDAGYVPDFVARVRDGKGEPLNLIVEVTGEKRVEKAAKIDAARTYWLPAVNGHGGFGRWAIVEIDEPERTKERVRTALRGH